jgi:hypothetical protein
MSKIRVENFGPIKKGLSHESFVHFDAVTIFIGKPSYW